MKETREGQQRTSKRNPIKLSPNFPAETLQEKREWWDIVRVMKGKIIKQKHSTQQGSHSYSMEKNQTLYRQAKSTEFSTTKPALQQLLKELL